MAAGAETPEVNRQVAEDARLPEPEATLASIHSAQVRLYLKMPPRLSLGCAQLPPSCTEGFEQVI